jgi:hypothetical protein
MKNNFVLQSTGPIVDSLQDKQFIVKVLTSDTVEYKKVPFRAMSSNMTVQARDILKYLCKYTKLYKNNTKVKILYFLSKDDHFHEQLQLFHPRWVLKQCNDILQIAKLKKLKITMQFIYKEFILENNFYDIFYFFHLFTTKCIHTSLNVGITEYRYKSEILLNTNPSMTAEQLEYLNYKLKSFLLFLIKAQKKTKIMKNLKRIIQNCTQNLLKHYINVII